jgi:glycosyltransferase involved in cell wall biosynthesis
VRILKVHTRYRERGGEDNTVRGDTEHLRAAGHEVLEYSVSNPEATLPTLRALAAAPWNPSAAREIRGVVRQFGPDIAHVHNTWFRLSPAAFNAIDDLGVPVVMSIHNYRLVCVNALLLRDGRICEDCVGHGPWRGVWHRCYRGSFALSAVAASTIAVGRARHSWDRVVERFIAPSTIVAEKLIAGGLPAEKFVVQPHGIADPGQRPVPPSESKTVLFVGRLAQEKGVDRLVDAWERAEISSLELVIVGEGPLRQPLESRRVRGVRFLGWRDPADVMGVMLRARALVFPSIWYEGFGRTIVEALGSGLPVMSPLIGAAGEIVSLLGERWVISPGSTTHAWAAGLMRLLDDDAIDEAGCRARELYEAEYTLELSTARLVDIYESVLGARRARTASG